MAFSIETLVLNATYTMNIIALLVNDLLLLRSILIVAQLLMISYGLLTNNQTIFLWNGAFFSINLYRVVRILLSRRAITIPEDLKGLYEHIFESMNKNEFIYFWNTGKIIKMRVGEMLICKNHAVDELSMILEGALLVNDTKQTLLKSGTFVDEVSFLSSLPAHFDISVEKPATLVCWSRKRLSQIQKINPDLILKLQRILHSDSYFKRLQIG